MTPHLLRRAHVLGLGLLVVAAGWGAGCTESSASSDEPDADTIRVAVTIAPQKTFVERIGGERVAVQVLVEPGGDPHTYEPTPRQVVELSKVHTYFTVGEPFEHALLPRLRAVNEKIHVVNVTEAALADARGDDEPDHDHGHGHHHHDTHTWVSPRLVAGQARAIAGKLAELDPDHAFEYAENLAAFLAEIDELDRDLRETLAPLAGSGFFVYHAAWSHFAADYGLHQVPVEVGGREPNAGDLVRLVERAKADRVRVLFVQPQDSRRSAEMIAREVGARLVEIDPLATDWADNLRHVARELAAAAAERERGSAQGE